MPLPMDAFGAAHCHRHGHEETMATIADTSRATGPQIYSWQTPAVIVASGCLIAMLSYGPRSALGQFLMPMSVDLHWGRDVFSLALALQNLLSGGWASRLRARLLTSLARSESSRLVPFSTQLVCG